MYQKMNDAENFCVRKSIGQDCLIATDSHQFLTDFQISIDKREFVGKKAADSGSYVEFVIKA